MDEREPLLREARDEEGAGDIEQPIDSPKKDRTVCCLCVAVLAAAFLFLAAAAIGTIVYGVQFYGYPEAVCKHLPTVVDAQTRSGSYALLVDVPREKCYEREVKVLLKSKESSVEIYQTFCEDIETKTYQTATELDDLTVRGRPTDVFDENFSPQNYFMSGTIQVEMINVSFVENDAVSYVDIVLCMFTNKDYFEDFLGAEKKWKNYTRNAECKATAVMNGEDGSNVTSFSINEPDFVFIGIVSNGTTVHMDLLNVTVMGEIISGLGENSTKECQVLGDNARTKTCVFDLMSNADPESSEKRVCVVAYEDDNSDGSYDYSNLTLSLQKHHNPHKKAFEGFGFSSLSVFVLVVVLLLAIISALFLRRHCNTSRYKLNNHGQVNCSPVQANGDASNRSLRVGNMDHVGQNINVSCTESAKT